MSSSELIVRLDDAEGRPDDAGRTLLEAVRAPPPPSSLPRPPPTCSPAFIEVPRERANRFLITFSKNTCAPRPNTPSKRPKEVSKEKRPESVLSGRDQTEDSPCLLPLHARRLSPPQPPLLLLSLLIQVRAEPLDPDVEAMVAARERLYPGPLAGLWSILLAVTLVVLLVAGPFAAALMIQPGSSSIILPFSPSLPPLPVPSLFLTTSPLPLPHPSLLPPPSTSPP